MNFYIVYWYRKDHHTNGWDLVFAHNKREARAIYRAHHYSPISSVIGPGDEDYDMLMEDMSLDDKATARLNGISDIEDGS